MFKELAKASSPLDDAYIKSHLQKWDMLRGLQFYSFSYRKHYHAMQANQFVLDLVNDPAFQAVFKVPQKNGDPVPLPPSILSVETEIIPCTWTRMDIFDKLNTAEPCVARPNGDIAKCMDDCIDGFQVSDLLREMILNESSENYDLLLSEEKSQLLWRLFEHICLGGPCCQFEDNITAYLEVAKKLYKSLLSVQRNPSTATVEVTSVVYKVHALTDMQQFSSSSRNNFFYVVADPLRRVCKVLYHNFQSYW